MTKDTYVSTPVDVLAVLSVGLCKPESLAVLPICELTLPSIIELDNYCNTEVVTLVLWPCKCCTQGLNMHKHKTHE